MVVGGIACEMDRNGRGVRRDIRNRRMPRSGTAKRDSAEEHRMLAREICPPRPRIPSGSGSDSIGLLPWK